MREVPNNDLLDRIADDFEDDDRVAMGTMFRNPGLRVRDKVFVFLSHDGQLIAKLPKARVDQLVAEGAAEPVVMGRRTMREWVVFPPDEDLWREIAREAHRFVSGGSGNAPSRS